MLDNFIPIGFTKKSHGPKGEIKVVIEPDYLQDFLDAKVLFIEIQGKPAPFFVDKIRPGSDLILKLEDVNSPGEAKDITSKKVYLRDQDIRTGITGDGGEDDLEYAFLRGFTLLDTEHGAVGEIEDVYEFPQQEMAAVVYKEREIFIPLHPDLIRQIDRENKKITLQLPAGLLDL